MLPIIIAAKVGIESCRFARECVSFMDALCNNPLETAACRVGSQQFLPFYCDPLNFKFLIVIHIFTNVHITEYRFPKSLPNFKNL